MSRQYVTATDITADTNHAGVRDFAGYSIREAAATAAAATVRFRLGALAGQILAVVELPADGSETFAFPEAIRTATGVYVEVVAGTVEGVIHSAV